MFGMSRLLTHVTQKKINRRIRGDVTQRTAEKQNKY